MADITMCNGTGCPLKEDCYRFNATPNEYRQSFFMEVPFGKKQEGRCDYFWDMRKSNTSTKVTTNLPKVD